RWLTQAGRVGFKAGLRKEMKRQTLAHGLQLSRAPIRHASGLARLLSLPASRRLGLGMVKPADRGVAAAFEGQPIGDGVLGRIIRDVQRDAVEQAAAASSHQGRSLIEATVQVASSTRYYRACGQKMSEPG